MIYLALSIFCSVTVGVLLKLAKRYQINIAQAITWNYLFAIGLSAFFFRPIINQLNITTIHVVLGVLLPTIFIFLALSVQRTGLARTDIAQRLSLFISLLAAFFIFNENYSILKYFGITIGFLAIIFTLYRKSTTQVNNTDWLYPLLVFIGFGVIDVCFKLISQYTTSSLFIIFCIAFFLSLLALTKKERNKADIILGIWMIIIGLHLFGYYSFVSGIMYIYPFLTLLNLGNILFYMKAHRAMSNDPSTVFAAMNIGVIIFGSLIGILVFKEKLSKLNYLGLLLALLSIILITLARY